MVRHFVVRSALIVGVLVAIPGMLSSQVTVAGNLAVLERGGKRANDIGTAVVWLERAGPANTRATKTAIVTQEKEFTPRVAVVPVGSTVEFPNHDPFSHNVFSVSEEAKFDLGLYDRGEVRTARFDRPGIVRVYCNIHAKMAAYVIVRDNPWFAQPTNDGSFSIDGVPPGKYTIRAWHERGGESSTPLEVTTADAAPVTLKLDASNYKYRPHLNKLGKPYAPEGRRY
jgi:plastocyanin